MRGKKVIIDRDKVRKLARDIAEGKPLELSPIKPSNMDRMAELSREVERIRNRKRCRI